MEMTRTPGTSWAGPLDVQIRIGPPVPLDRFVDRKELARYAEDKVRNDVTELLRGG